MQRFLFYLASLLAASSSIAAEIVPVTVQLHAQNNSRQTGMVTLTPAGDKTKVVIEMKDVTSDTPQPAHIHLGSCAKLDKAPKWPLDPVVDGKSTTVVPASLRDIMEKPSAVNVHKSQAEVDVYVACGDIRANEKPRR